MKQAEGQARADATRGGSTPAEPAHTDPMHAAPAHTDPAQADATRTGTVRSGSARADRWEESWEHWWVRFLVAVPWVLLAASVVAILNGPGRDAAGGAGGGGVGVSLGLTLLAAVWVLFGTALLTREEEDDRPALTVVYFVGLVAVGGVLMAHDMLFVIFATTPFFHAMILPLRLILPGVAFASVVFNSFVIGVPGLSAQPDSAMSLTQHVILYAGVIALQSLAIGGSMVAGRKSSEHWRERKEMVARLEAALEENAGLHAQLLTQVREAGVHDERQRMAREIHDTLAQGLTGIITQLHAVQRSWDEPETAHTHVDRALALARESLTEARRSVQALRPHQLAQSQLPEALAELAWSRGQEMGVRPGLEVTGEPVPLSPAIEVVLFRVAQESLANVAKHAGASRVGVTLSYLDDVVLLDVRDDGRGLPADPGNGFGLTSMRQRVRGIGGAMEIESEAGVGTAVSVTVPLVPGEGSVLGERSVQGEGSMPGERVGLGEGAEPGRGSEPSRKAEPGKKPGSDRRAELGEDSGRISGGVFRDVSEGAEDASGENPRGEGT